VTDVAMKYVIPIMMLASVPLGIAAYQRLPKAGTVKARSAETAESTAITLPDEDVENACRSAYSQLLVLGNTLQSPDCIEHRFIDHNTGVLAFDVMLADGPKRMSFAVRRRADGKNWDLFDPKTGKLWSEVLIGIGQGL